MFDRRRLYIFIEKNIIKTIHSIKCVIAAIYNSQYISSFHLLPRIYSYNDKCHGQGMDAQIIDYNSERDVYFTHCVRMVWPRFKDDP